LPCRFRREMTLRSSAELALSSAGGILRPLPLRLGIILPINALHRGDECQRGPARWYCTAKGGWPAQGR
jgi:hypothetical protein